jgi:hypothetical protein
MDTNRILENDPDYQRFTQTCDAQHQAAMDAFDGLIASIRHEMIIHRTREYIATEEAKTEAAPLETIEETIKRATGQDVVSISIYDPLINEKLRAIYGTWGGVK